MTHYEISDVFAGFRAIFRGIHENCSHFSPKTSNNITVVTQTCQLFSTPRPANTRSPAYFSVTDPLRNSTHRDAPARADKPIPHHPQPRPARHPRPRPRPRCPRLPTGCSAPERNPRPRTPQRTPQVPRVHPARQGPPRCRPSPPLRGILAGQTIRGIAPPTQMTTSPRPTPARPPHSIARATLFK